MLTVNYIYIYNRHGADYSNSTTDIDVNQEQVLTNEDIADLFDKHICITKLEWALEHIIILIFCKPWLHNQSGFVHYMYITMNCNFDKPKLFKVVQGMQYSQ